MPKPGDDAAFLTERSRRIWSAQFRRALETCFPLDQDKLPERIRDELRRCVTAVNGRASGRKN